MRETEKTRPRLSLGFIGGGINSAVGNVHYGASRLDGRWRLDAGAFSTDAARSHQTAEQWHVAPERSYADWREFLAAERDRLDAVAVLTPTPLHVDMVIECLKAGLPVICEKSLTRSCEEIDRIRAAHDPGKAFLAVTYNYSGYPMVRELRERIAAGELGEIEQIHLEMPQEGFVRPPDIAGRAAPPQAWRLEDDEVPTVCLDLGVHLHHLASFLLGTRPEEVMADFGTYSPYRQIVDYVSLWARYPNNVRCSMWFTKTAVGRRNGMKVRVFGSRGSAEWVQVDPDELRLDSVDGNRCILDRGGSGHVIRDPRYNRMKAGHPAGFVEAFANLYVDLADAVLAHRKDGAQQPHPYVHGLDEAEAGIRFFAAAGHSSRSGRWVRLDDFRAETEQRG